MSDMPKFDVKYSDNFIKNVCDTATQLISNGETEATLDEKHFGQLSVFIDNKPQNVFFSFPAELLDENLKGKIIYVGG